MLLCNCVNPTLIIRNRKMHCASSSSLFTPPPPYQSRRNTMNSASHFNPLLTAVMSSGDANSCFASIYVTFLCFWTWFLAGSGGSGGSDGCSPRALAIIAFTVFFIGYPSLNSLTGDGTLKMIDNRLEHAPRAALLLNPLMLDWWQTPNLSKSRFLVW